MNWNCFFNYWYKHEKLTPSDLLTSLLAPFLFFFAGLAIGVVKDWKKRKKEKVEENQIKEIIFDWLKQIQDRLNIQYKLMQSVFEAYERGDDKINQEFVIIPIDRLLSLPDLELRKVIIGEKFYITIISDLSYVRHTQELLRNMFEDWANKTTEIERQRRELNDTGFDITFRLCSVKNPQGFGDGLFHAWRKLVNNREKIEIIGDKAIDFYNNFLMVFYHNVEVNILDSNIELHPYVKNFLDLMEEYNLFVRDIEQTKIQYLNNLNYQKNQFENMANNIGNFLKTVK